MSDTPQGNVTDPVVAPGPNIPGQGNVTPTPGAEPGAPGQAVPDKHVPLQALHEEREKRQQLQSSNQELQDQLNLLKTQVQMMGANQPQPQAQPQQAMPQQQRDVRAEIDALWETDPRRAMQMEMQMAIQWYDGVNATLDSQEDEVSKKHPDFGQHRPEVRRYLRQLPAHQRSTPGVVELAYYTVKGQKVDDLLKQNQAELLRRIQAGEMVQGLTPGATGTPSSLQTQGGAKYTDQEAKVAAAMGMTVEDYLKNKK